jgi:molybdenum cofactor cytidylyltransferase
MGELPGMKENVFRGTVTATRNRLEGLGSRLALVLRCRHERGRLRKAKLREALAAGCDLLLMAGATVTKDRLDTVPPRSSPSAAPSTTSACRSSRATCCCSRTVVGAVPVLVLPGCARSRRSNGLDWVLQRLSGRIAARTRRDHAHGRRRPHPQPARTRGRGGGRNRERARRA